LAVWDIGFIVILDCFKNLGRGVNIGLPDIKVKNMYSPSFSVVGI